LAGDVKDFSENQKCQNSLFYAVNFALQILLLKQPINYKANALPLGEKKSKTLSARN
jgi:hypothetical protein